ncbi:hypothetical protein DFA_03695 [Cavenderia fasciculata]|uniref:BTB domain-containing protein n=1 Tax=Cavenderia fasciculata TaxID=261658 RepID=F4Q1Q8_CACFS|nr:uncharacterized protein DFA_03695 [Cavenderia fasciculata]EGG18208.1 hypothetical protein DFA_03695 [Cavenderia fasciculata]|eukprot:XP_004357031.1 hypothetical protein DFA_03695 [Cavenderia fasciculata]
MSLYISLLFNTDTSSSSSSSLIMEITTSTSNSFRSTGGEKEKEKDSFSSFASKIINKDKDKDKDKEKDKDSSSNNKESDKINRLLDKLKKQIEKEVQQKYAGDLKELEKYRSQSTKSSKSGNDLSSKLTKSPSLSSDLNNGGGGSGGGTVIASASLVTQKGTSTSNIHHHHHHTLGSSNTTKNDNNHQPVVLNIGGQIHQTLKSTLTKNSGYFEIYFGDYNTQPNPITNQYFIDKRCHYFHIILDYLRGEDIHNELKEGKVNIDVFKQELNYFEIDYSNLFPKHKFDKFTRHNSMDVAPGNYTITHRGEKDEPMGIISIKGFNSGSHQCRFRIDKICDDSYWMCFGTAYASTSSPSAIPFASSFSLSSRGQTYPECTEVLGRAGDWISGDVIRVELDFDTRTQRVINERTNKTETFLDLPTNIALFFYANLSNPGNQVSIICDHD